MKKLFIFSFILVVTMGMIYSQSLTITSPSGGTWYKGTTQNITWTASGCSSSNYKINIFRGSIDVANFVEQLTASGTTSKSWTIPMGYTNGTYYIRIKTDPAQTGCQGDSRAFTITDPSSPEPGTAASITVTSPTTGTKWVKGTTRTITWDKSGDLDSNVKINIFRNSISEANFVEQLTGPNNGSKSWNIPASYDLGTYYLRIKEAVGTVQGDSRAFEITQMFVMAPVIATLFKPHSIEIVEPSGGRVLALNSRTRILWRPKNLTNNVKISLMKGRMIFGVIAEDLAPGRISEEWTIGRTLIKTALPGSGFRIKIEEMGQNVSVLSDAFSIEAARDIDLSCYVSGHSSRDYGRVVRLTVKVRVNNFGGPPLARVPVQVSVRTQSSSPGSGETETKYLENVTYRGHSYEYSLSFDFRLQSGSRYDSRRLLGRVATVVVDPADTFRDRRRRNNTSTYTFSF